VILILDHFQTIDYNFDFKSFLHDFDDFSWQEKLKSFYDKVAILTALRKMTCTL